MSQIAYIDGRYVPRLHATTSIEDRGYQFADAVYEGIGFVAGHLMAPEGHYARLLESLAKVDIPLPMPLAAIRLVARRMIELNRVHSGFLYIQISRGVAPREHSSYGLECPPVMVMTVKPQPLAAFRRFCREGIRMGLAEDLRWQRCDIKTTGLLANCLAKTRARAQGNDDAVLVDSDGLITEGTASNIWIVDAGGTLRTRELSPHILRGITRTELLEMLDGVAFREAAFTVEEARNAREMFITSASMALRPVVAFEGRPVGDGSVGGITRKLQRRFLEAIAPELPDILGLEPTRS